MSMCAEDADVEGLVRSELERQMALGRVEGLSNAALGEILGLSRHDVCDALYSLIRRVRRESADMVRSIGIGQTVSLTQLYRELYDEWVRCKDPRYAESMRGCLADIRKIWGVDSPRAVNVDMVVGGKGGVLGGVLGRLSEGELSQLECILESGDSGSEHVGCDDGEGLSSSEGLCSVDGSFPVD